MDNSLTYMIKQRLLPIFALLFLLGFTACNSSDEVSLEIEGVNAEKVWSLIKGQAGKKAVVVNFWASWCKPCVEELPYFKQAQQANSEVEFLLISMDDQKEDANKALNKIGIAFKTYIQDQETKQFLAAMPATWGGELPYTMIFDKNGNKVTQKSGKVSQSELNQMILKAIDSGSAEENTLDIGDKMPMPTYKMKNIDGSELALHDVKKENGTLVIFTCNTCPWVVVWEDRYNLVSDIASKNNIGVIFVNSNERQREGVDSLAAMKEHAEKMKYNFPYTVDKDHQLADAFNAQKTPDVFLFNGNDELVYKGAIDDNAKQPEKVQETYLEDALNELGAGKEISKAYTKALGCSIKRLDSK